MEGSIALKMESITNRELRSRSRQGICSGGGGVAGRGQAGGVGDGVWGVQRDGRAVGRRRGGARCGTSLRRTSALLPLFLLLPPLLPLILLSLILLLLPRLRFPPHRGAPWGGPPRTHQQRGGGRGAGDGDDSGDDGRLEAHRAQALVSELKPREPKPHGRAVGGRRSGRDGRRAAGGVGRWVGGRGGREFGRHPAPARTPDPSGPAVPPHPLGPRRPQPRPSGRPAHPTAPKVADTPLNSSSVAMVGTGSWPSPASIGAASAVGVPKPDAPARRGGAGARGRAGRAGRAKGTKFGRGVGCVGGGDAGPPSVVLVALAAPIGAPWLTFDQEGEGKADQEGLRDRVPPRQLLDRPAGDGGERIDGSGRRASHARVRRTSPVRSCPLSCVG